MMRDSRPEPRSGTLPQVAADYGINAYFRDALGVYVNLYLHRSQRTVGAMATASRLSCRAACAWNRSIGSTPTR